MKINHVGGNPSEAYTVVDNTLIRDPDLSLRSRGLMALLLSHNTGFELTSVAISKQTTEGRDAVRSAMAELEAAGYLRHHRYRDGGKWFVRLDVYRHRNAPADQGVEPEKPAPESQAPENPVLQKTRPGFSGAGFPGVYKKTKEEDQQEGSDLTFDGGAGLSSEVSTEAASQVGTPGFPMFARAALDALNPTDTEKHEWNRAWFTITALENVTWDATLHLTKYLARCKELRKRPNPTEWTRWYVEDEAKAATELAERRRTTHDDNTTNPYWE